MHDPVGAVNRRSVHDPRGAGRRRPPRPQRHPDDPRQHGRPHSGGRGDRRPRGRRGDRARAAGRRADGRPHARHGRDRGHRRGDRADACDPDRHPHHVRARRVRLRRAAGRRVGLPAQAHVTRGADRRDPRRRGRRGAAVAVGDPAPHPGVRDDAGRAEARSRAGRIDRARARGAGRAGQRWVEHRPGRAAVHLRGDRADAREAGAAQARAARPGAGHRLRVRVGLGHARRGRTTRRRIRAWQVGSGKRTSHSSGSARASRTWSARRSS